MIVWDKRTGKPVCNAIVWQCRRTAEYCDELKAAGLSGVVKEKTGLVPDAYFSGTKIKWILDNIEGVREEAEKGNILFGTVDVWLIWNLTKGKVHATDYTNASRTMLFNIHTLEWDCELLDELTVPRAMLPEVKPSSYTYGYTSREYFGGEIAIEGVAGDQQAALFGQRCFEKGSVKNTYGTGCFILMNTGHSPVRSQNNLLTTVAWGVGGKVEYALEGSVFTAGAAVQWLRDGLKLIDTASESEQCAARVEDTNGMYFVPAFTGLGTPYWEQYARGMAVGMTGGINRNHYVRAILESIAYQSYDVIKAMEADAGVELKYIKVDGGASANNFLMQFQADILNSAVERPPVIESTALGVSYLAGLSSGMYESIAEIVYTQESGRKFLPTMTEETRCKLLDGWHKAVKISIEWAK